MGQGRGPQTHASCLIDDTRTPDSGTLNPRIIFELFCFSLSTCAQPIRRASALPSLDERNTIGESFALYAETGRVGQKVADQVRPTRGILGAIAHPLSFSVDQNDGGAERASTISSGTTAVCSQLCNLEAICLVLWPIRLLHSLLTR
jgi:hypothetical protein